MEKTSRRKKGGSDFLIQGTILAVAGIIVRLIGMLYRIPLAEKIGDEGLGYYTSAFQIYSILLIMSSYSLPVGISKMVATRLARREYKNVNRVFKTAMVYATIAGGLGAFVMWFGADYFAAAMKMPFSAYALRTLAPTIWVMAYLGVLRGYFQGHSTMVPTAVSQIFEQIINAVISIVAATLLFDAGVKSNLVYGGTEYSYAFGAAGGTIGTGAGAVTALLFLLVLFGGYHATIRHQMRRDKTKRIESYGQISGVMAMTILPIIFSSVIYNISAVVDNFIFGNAMAFMGRNAAIAADWGVYSGKYHLLFNIPVAIATALSSSLIPPLSRAVAEQDRRQVLSKVSSAVRFSMIVAIPSAVGLTVLAAPISHLLFQAGDNQMLIQMTMVGSLAVVVYSLSTVTNGVLQGINHMQMPIISAAIALVVHVIVLAVMMYGFHMGIYSVVYANILFAFLVCIINAFAIKRYLRYHQEIKKTFLVPTVSAGIMGAVAFGTYQLLHRFTKEIFSGRLGYAIDVLPTVCIAAAVYFILLIKLGGINEEELRGMPGGTRIRGLAKKLHLM